jgi:hypothetical protein
VHDSFEFRTPEGSARVGSDGHHGTHAARFLARFVGDPVLVEVMRSHDEAFAAWVGLTRRGDRRRAEQRVRAPAGGSAPPCRSTRASSAPTTRPATRAGSRSRGSSRSPAPTAPDAVPERARALTASRKHVRDSHVP